MLYQSSTLKLHRAYNIFWAINALKHAIKTQRMTCYVYNTKEVRQILSELQKVHLIYSFRVLKGKNNNDVLVYLRPNTQKDFLNFKRVSRPGLKVYKSYDAVIGSYKNSNPSTVFAIRTKQGVRIYTPRIQRKAASLIGGELLLYLA